MKRKFYYLLPVIGMIALNACSLQEEIVTRNQSKKADLQVRETGMIVKPVVADLDISNEKKSVVYVADLKIPLNNINDNTMQLFLETFKCDYIIDPKFVRKTTVNNSKLKQIEVTLTGFPATYKRIYQVDSLPKSITEYANINLPIKTTDYISLYQADERGSNLGMEFYAGTSFVGSQIDFAPKVKGTHFYLSFEQHVNESSAKYRGFNDNIATEYNANYSSIRTLSLGVFYEKEILRNIRLRGLGGFNYAYVLFDESVQNITYETIVDGIHSMGLRFGASVDYSLTRGFSVIARAHTNLGLYNSLKESGEFVLQDYSNISITNFPLVNLGLGIRYSF